MNTATTVVKYCGDLRTEAVHVRSGNILITDAPLDNHGRGEAFSPTDLVLTALCSCLLTIMGIKAVDLGVDLRGTRIEAEKIMQENPRRIAKLVVNVFFTSSPGVRQRKLLEAAALACPVAKSLHEEIEQKITFYYPQQDDGQSLMADPAIKS